MDDRQAYERELEDKLEAMRAEIDALRAKAAQAPAHVAEDLQEDMDDLHVRRETLRGQLSALRAADDATWKQKRAEIEGGWSDLDAVIRKLHSRF